MDFKREIALLVALKAGLEAAQTEEMLEIPPNPEMGDYALPCFKLAKQLRKSPADIAAHLAASIERPGFLREIKALGGYLNFTIDRGAFIAETVGACDAAGANWGSMAQNGKTICIDYSSINIAKPFHIGHLLTTVIGNALKNIFTKLGYRVIGINHLGDWGTQFGKLIYAYKAWGSEEQVERGGVSELSRLYVRFHEEAERDEKLNDEARAWFKRIEDGDKEAVELFEWFKKTTLREVGRVYEMLGVSFDYYQGESFYNDKMDRVIDELKAKSLLEPSEGAYVVRLDEYNLLPCIVLKSDGATLYSTRDLAAAIYRKETFDFHKCLYVVAYQQNLHFQQVFAVLERMGYEWASDMVHVAFGMVSLEDGTLSTRKGKVVLLEDVLKRSVEKTLSIIKEKSPGLANKEEVAKDIGVGAVIFNALYSSRIKDMVFSWERALNFDGETAPYVQYTHARCMSVIEKAGEVVGAPDYSALDNKEGYEAARLLCAFGETLLNAASKYEPYLLTRYLVELAQAFNKYYYEHRLIDDKSAARTAAGLSLCRAVGETLKSGLALLGIKAPDKM